jgi:sugar-specific transcriptional regulator TrmB
MKNIGGSTNPIESVEKVVQACSDYLKIAEQECTKRRNIEAWEKITLKKIKSSSDFLMAYLERSFDERSEGFRRMFDALDRAVETGNNEQLAATLEAVVKLAQSSPFKDLSDVNSVRAALDDPDHEWEL